MGDVMAQSFHAAVLETLGILTFPGMHEEDDWTLHDVEERYPGLFKEKMVVIVETGGLDNHLVQSYQQLMSLRQVRSVYRVPEATWLKIRHAIPLK